MEKENPESKIALFRYEDVNIEVRLEPENDTVWLNRNQLAELFGRDIKTIGKHINNALREELCDQVVVAKFATTTQHGAIEGKTQTHLTEYYNLDMILSVGYRVKSKRGIAFRKWANEVLRNYIIRGYAVNNNRITQLSEVIRVMKRTENNLDTTQVLDVIERYTAALDMLDDYDHQCIKKPQGNVGTYLLTYEECRELIDSMRFNAESTLFGNEKDDSFKGSIGNIYQTFADTELYPTIEEKAAMLLYSVTKNHSFSDGNKRIAAAVFLYFLEKNGILMNDGKKIISDHTLVAIIVMIAESNPEEKDVMIRLVMNFLIG